MTLQTVIFDVDGTLADTERDGHRAAFNTAFREAGLDWEWNVPLYSELLAATGGKERMRAYVEKYRRDLLARSDVDDMIAGLHRAKTKHYVALMEQGGIPPRPGVVRLVQELRAAGLRLAIATTTTPENVEVMLCPTLAVLPPGTFEVIGADNIMPAKKPAPDIYRWVLERLRLPASKGIAIEDSRNGAHGAWRRLAGGGDAQHLNTVGEDFTGATAVVNELGEPDRPFTLLQGAAHGRQWVGPELLRAWASEASVRPAAGAQGH